MSDDTEPIATALGRLARDAPDRPALTIAEQTVSRSQLEATSNRLARAFAIAGVEPEDLVTIALPNSVEFIEAAIACWKLGAVPQPVSYRLPARELQAIVEVADSKLIVGVDASHVPGRATWAAGRRPDPTMSDAPLPVVVASTWKAPTSGGSTGRPKLIMSGQPSVIPLAPSHGLRHDGVVLIPGPLYHNAPFTFACLGLFYGNHVVVMPRFDAEATLAAIDRHRPDLVLLVPTMMSRVLRLEDSVRERYDISSLQTVWHMGAPCAPWVKERWLHWVGPEKVWELYTGTESQAVSTVRGDEWLAKPGTVGRVTTGEMQVVDADTLQAVPAGVIGEIFLRRSPGTPETYRYVGAEPYAIDNGWESLGDMGWFDDDGFLFLADRRADMILSGGANIYPAEIEAALIEHPAVQSCAVVGLPDDDLGQVVHAIVQPIDASAVPSDDDLRAFLAERVIRYKVPRTYEWVNEPVRDDAGKVRRGMLRDERIVQ